MKLLFALVFLLFTSIVVSGQPLQFTLADTTLLPAKPDGMLHGISAIEFVPGTQEWHLASDRGGYFVFDSIGNIRDFDRTINQARIRQTGLWYEAVRHDASSGSFVYAVENEYKPSEDNADTTTYVAYYESFPSVLPNPSYIIPPMPLPADNKGIESLAITLSGALWVAPEAGWAGETEVGGDTIHFKKFERDSAAYREAGSFSYVIDRSGCPHGTSETRGGISEIIAVEERRLLVLERCFDNGPGGSNKIKAKLWEVNVAGNHLKKMPEPAFDFARDMPFNADNLEGMAWWPATGGKRQLLLVTDDNPGLKNKQRTQFILLKEK